MLWKENKYLLNIKRKSFILSTQQRTADLTESDSNKENLTYYIFNRRLLLNLIQKT